MRRSRLYGIAAVAASVCTTVLVLGGIVGGGSAAHAVTSPLHGPLAASNGHLVDEGAGGGVVTLRGVTLQATATSPQPGGILDAKGLQTLLAWGANFARIQLSSDALLQKCPNEVYDPNYGTELTDAVNQLTSNGVYVLLDVHATNPGCLWSGPQTSGTAALPGEDVIPALSELAGEFGANPLVGYEPFNEPEACAEATSGPGAGLFVPSSTYASGVCPNEALAAQALMQPGQITVPTRLVFGISLGLTSYPTPGFVQEYDTIMSHLPSGSPSPLVFLDDNYFSSDRATFDNLPPALAAAGNLVQVQHPYDCQDVGNGSAVCDDATPETCTTIGQDVARAMTDPATGGAWSRPVVFDEFNFPASETTYQVRDGSLLVPIRLYQHGYWVNNMVAALQNAGASGWALLHFQNADMDQGVTTYSLVVSGITQSTPTPWQPNVNAANAVTAMQGQRLSCEPPPIGYDIPF